MATYPSLPLFTDALLGDTQHLTATEFGAYMFMLVIAWRSPDCALPLDDRYLARITRVGRGWNKIKGIVLAYWTLEEDGKLHQKRLSKERLRVAEYVSQKSNAGKSSALKRNESTPTNVGVALTGRCNGDPTPIPSPIPSPTNKTSSGAVPPQFEEFWASYPKRPGDSKKEASEVYARVAKTTDPAVILSGAQRCRARLKQEGKLEFAKGTASWLRKACWESEPGPKAFSEGRGAYV